MVDGVEGEDNPNVRYWKTKYELLHADYGRTKERTEDLESRLLEIVEESDRKDNENEQKIRELQRKLEDSNRQIEQLEGACFRYKNQSRGEALTTSCDSEKCEEKLRKSEEKEEEEILMELQRVNIQRTLSGGSTRSSIDGITRSPEFHAGEHLICEYHKLPILSKGEGFIYGFRWNITNKIHIV